MTLDEYQQGTLETWCGDNREPRAFLSLAEESGEVIGKYQKYLRGDFNRSEMVEKVKAELGDLLFYVAVTAHELGLSMEEVAKANYAKLRDRKSRGVLMGSGDNR